MALPSDYTSGTITLTNGSTAFTGTGTGWLAADLREGDIILDVEGGEGAVAVIASITSNTAGVLSKEWEGPTLTDVAYRMRYQWDSGRVSAQSRAAIEMLGNGNLQSFASITGPGVPVFEGPHSVTIKPESDFVNGVAYDVQVDTIADRDAYDGQSEGFAVLVSDVGDGRSALYSKNSNAVGDWSDPAYITGPSVSVTVGTTTEGPFGSLPDVTGVTGAGSLQLNFELPGSPSIDATVSSSPPGTTASVVTTPVTGGYELDFTLPEASGFYNAGVYDVAEAYNQDDVVRHNGSSFIALQSVPAGEAPSSASPPVDTSYWAVLAAKGQDGTGTGDMVGPNGGVADGDLVAFADATGKLTKKAGGVSNAQLAAMANATIKGRNSAGTGAPEDVTMAQLLGLLKTAGAYAKDNILGTVSQVSGVPTGAIIERGSNANGEYIRYADGTQICSGRLTRASVAVTGTGTTSGVFYEASPQAVTFPAAFLTGTVPKFVHSETSGNFMWTTGSAPISNTQGRFWLVAASSEPSRPSDVNWIAIGRWF